VQEEKGRVRSSMEDLEVLFCCTAKEYPGCTSGQVCREVVMPYCSQEVKLGSASWSSGFVSSHDDS